MEFYFESVKLPRETRNLIPIARSCHVMSTNNFSWFRHIVRLRYPNVGAQCSGKLSVRDYYLQNVRNLLSFCSIFLQVWTRFFTLNKCHMDNSNLVFLMIYVLTASYNFTFDLSWVKDSLIFPWQNIFTPGTVCLSLNIYKPSFR